jgi:hypothetical protein
MRRALLKIRRLVAAVSSLSAVGVVAFSPSVPSKTARMDFVAELLPLHTQWNGILLFDILTATSTRLNMASSSSSSSSSRPKKQLSMAEKRAKRASKRVAVPTLPDTFPPCKLDFKTPLSKRDGTSTTTTSTSSTATTTPTTTTTTPGLDASQKITDPQVAEQRAQKLVQAQRESVAMLTRVRERIEALPMETIQSCLDHSGYFVMDDFLHNATTLDELQQEGLSMLLTHNQMQLDLIHLGSGEYIAAIQGGAEQYTQCPRMVELVVSITKHLPPQLNNNNNNNNNTMTTNAKTLPLLDSSNCMATLRTFDRNALKASLALLTAGNEDETTVDSSQRSLGNVATEPNDQRKVSVFYYVVPATWSEDCGGGLSFRGGEDDGSKASSSPTVVHAKRDRLVILNSASTPFRREVWKGKDSKNSNAAGSCLELHLVQKKDSMKNVAKVRPFPQ